jgi:hypothetical protein
MRYFLYYKDIKNNEYLRLRENGMEYYWYQPFHKQQPELFVEDLERKGVGYSRCRFPDDAEKSTFHAYLKANQTAINLQKVFHTQNPHIQIVHEDVRDFVVSMQHYIAFFEKSYARKYKNKRKGSC